MFQKQMMNVVFMLAFVARSQSKGCVALSQDKMSERESFSLYSKQLAFMATKMNKALSKAMQGEISKGNKGRETLNQDPQSMTNSVLHLSSNSEVKATHEWVKAMGLGAPD